MLGNTTLHMKSNPAASGPSEETSVHFVLASQSVGQAENVDANTLA